MKNFRFFSGLLCLLAVCLAAPFAHAASSTPANGIQLTPLATFYNTNGANPYDAPLFGPDGNLYGTTYAGGSNNAGVIFKVTLASKLSTLHMFATNDSDGQNPASPLIVGPDGAMYGTTSLGGTNSVGTIFKVTTNGIYTPLYSFGMSTNSAGYDLDGSTPYAGLTLGRDGNFYGVTYDGGVSNAGTVFQFTPGGILNTLYSFTGGNDGGNPYEATLVEGATGVFYGAAYRGGTNGDGTIFQITSGGDLTTLWQFGGTNGEGPYAGLQFAADGNLYGTTIQGGTNGGGTIFSITTNGDFTLLFQFDGDTGYYPEGGVTPGPFNNLYGVTYNGGIEGDGSIFAFTTNGQYTTIYSFTNVNDGNTPLSPLFRDASGNLYGSTYQGGKPVGLGFLGSGVVFRYTDLFRPTNSITLPAAGQRWSNIVLNATGTTRENAGVGYVFYSLNGAPWAMATTANVWTNWSASLTLTPGTNKLQAYAVDVNDNYSPTNTTSFVYVPGYSTALLTVLTNGQGTITPNYNNALLLIGTNYSMTAKPANGSAFTNWTDASSNVVSASATLDFTMAANLTYVANFVDVMPPTVKFTSPKSGTRATNTVGNVYGSASDNIAVSNVFVSVNSGAWTNATFYSNTNWYATVTLTAGSNTVSAYAVDTSGNISQTNTLLLDQIPGGMLTVIFNGSGTLTPNYSNALLAVGHTYTMKAAGNTGYTFYYWKSGSTMITNASLSFVMATNLTNTANFKDIEAPIIEVTTPAVNQKYSNSVITCTGYAYDNSLTVGGVMCQMNGGEWFPATSTSGSFYTWTTTNSFPVNLGANVFAAYAYDNSGNISKTNVVKFTGFTPPAPAPQSLTNLMITTTGQTNTYAISCATNNTFSQMNLYAAGDSGVGAYAYQNTSTNTGSLQLTFTATPDMTNENNSQAIQLTFSSTLAGTFTNATTTDWGSFTLATALPYPPKSFSGHNFTNTPAIDNNETNIFKFTSASSVTIVTNGVTNGIASYLAARPSPPDTLFTITNDNFVDYLQLHFTSLNQGRYQFNTYDTGGAFQTNEFGSFIMR